MTVSTYATLLTRVQTILARSDLTADVQDFVFEAEKEIFSRLRVKEMVTRTTTLTPTSGVIATPSDYIAAIDLRRADKLRVGLEFNSIQQLFERDEDAWGEGRGYYTEIGTDLHIRPTPADAQTYALIYFARPAALTSGSQETNSIFPVHADIYLYGALWKGFHHTRAREKANEYFSLMGNAVEQRNDQYKMERESYGSIELCAPVVA